MKRALEAMTREAREDFGRRPAPDIDWDAVEAKLFARVDALAKAERARFNPSPRRPWVAFAAFGLAALAIVAVTPGLSIERVPLATEGDGRAEPIGVISEVASGGHVLLRGAPVDPGAAVAVGDEVEVLGADAWIESPGRVRVRLEQGSRLRVTRRRVPLVMALDQGAVEVEVTRVARGETFAVDVERSRVAAHGTHFRVARAGERAQLDLTEGVVAVGEAPREGPVVGTTVVAPAHVEFSVASAVATLAVSHDRAAVLAPSALWGGASAESSSTGATKTAEPVLDPTGARTLSPSHGAEAHVASSPPPSAAPDSGPLAAPVAPEDALAAAVRACMRERPRADNVTVLFRTTLELDVGDEGEVQAARFDPPVLPDVNACAAPSIYRVRFARGGSVAIPIEFKN